MVELSRSGLALMYDGVINPMGLTALLVQKSSLFMSFLMQLDMENEDVIDVFIEQLGGGHHQQGSWRGYHQAPNDWVALW